MSADQKRADELQLGDLVVVIDGICIVVAAIIRPSMIWKDVDAVMLMLADPNAEDATRAPLPRIIARGASAILAEGFGCPRCLLISQHPKDIEARYCGNCHVFWPRLPR